MLLHILSDLHLEFGSWTPPETGADVVILAGDTHVGLAGVAWAASAFADRTVVYVPGNHEYYGEAYPRHLQAMRRAAAGTNVHVLDRGVLELPAIRILGCTLWTDFALQDNPGAAMALAAEFLWDYREIRISPRLRPARPQDALRWHRRARAWLARELATSRGRALVVTHHAPCRGSVSPAPHDRPYAPAYASDLRELIIRHEPVCWIHGHTHRRRDDLTGSTRIISNPRGYPDQHDTGFVPDMVIEAAPA